MSTRPVYAVTDGRAALPHPIQPERDDQPTGGVAVYQHAGRTCLLADDLQCAIELAVVAGQVGGEVRGQAAARRAPTLAQVQRIEGEPAAGEMIGQRGVEEVVGVSVHCQDRIGGRRGIATTQQRRVDVALAVGVVTQRDGELPVAGQDIGLPASHGRQLKAWSPLDPLTPSGVGQRGDDAAAVERRPEQHGRCVGGRVVVEQRLAAATRGPALHDEMAGIGTDHPDAAARVGIGHVHPRRRPADRAELAKVFAAARPRDLHERVRRELPCV